MIRRLSIWGYWEARLLSKHLTHWGRVTHICVGNLVIIGSDNGLSPGRHQAIIWTNAWILLIGPLGTNFSEISIAILTFHSRKSVLKCRLRNMAAIFSRPQCVKLPIYYNPADCKKGRTVILVIIVYPLHSWWKLGTCLIDNPEKR